MKILIIANNDIGLYKFRRELIEELLKKHDVFICLPDGKFVKKLISLGCTFILCNRLDCHGTNPLNDVKLFFWYKKIIKKYRPNIVLTYTIKPNVYGGAACAALNVPYIVNVTGLGTALENGGLLQKISLLLYRFGVRKAKRIFFQNIENCDFMIRNHVIQSPYDVIPGSGVNLSQYQVLEYPDSNIVKFAFIARIIKEKGIEQYLEAAQYIRRKYPNTQFHICGVCDYNYKKRLEDLNKAGTIIYHGLVSNMEEIYRIISCTVHPTYYPEGLSNVLLESAACGRPIITTNRSGCREVVENGVNGYVVKEKDSQDLIEKIEMFLSESVEERKQMGLAGRRKVEKEFSRQIVINKYMREIENIQSNYNK